MEQKTTWVAVLDVSGLTSNEYDSVIRRMDVENNPAAGIYFHAATQMDNNAGIRIVELWDDKDGFESFVRNRLIPVTNELGLSRQTTVTITPLLNAFAPRLGEIDALPQIRERE